MNKADLARMIVDDVLTRWPPAVRAFNRMKMACPGCTMAPFETVGEACAAYGVKVARLESVIREELDAAPSPVSGRGELP
ncbi:MAG: hypothetical protein COW30_13080 [Rhodospirillales bacterium CG15_BIG_FIL_POST_REV_8_21_14_020_66_15]|nr:MAG: hypothetical protein COW30_13080 [Rhodospirillales bacterium CG15_BIG_FIL_POST_REV_8_21_14_020_66_15]